MCARHKMTIKKIHCITQKTKKRSDGNIHGHCSIWECFRGGGPEGAGSTERHDIVDERYAQGHPVEASGQSYFSASHAGSRHTHRHTVQVECVLRLPEVPLGQLLHG